MNKYHEGAVSTFGTASNTVNLGVLNCIYNYLFTKQTYLDIVSSLGEAAGEKKKKKKKVRSDDEFKLSCVTVC